MELYRTYRPQTLKGVVGQDQATATIQKLLDKGKLPHCLLLTGPSGVGKTTIARIVKNEMHCGDADFNELNCADFRGIEDVRNIRRAMQLNPIAGKCRMWLIDECHRLTGDAQDAMLKMLEDTPAHVYFMLCTTLPQKLLPTIRTRATQIKLAPLKLDELQRIVQRVVDKEKLEVSQEVVEEICDASDFSARKALVLLEQVANLETEEDQLRAIVNASFSKEDAFKLAQLVFNFGKAVGKGSTWPEIAKVLRNMSEQDVEGIRYCILGYARTVLVGKEDKAPSEKWAHKAMGMVEIFGRNMYDSKSAGLAAACYEAWKNL